MTPDHGIEEELRFCYERIIPPALEAAGMKFWPCGIPLCISFLDGYTEVKDQVKAMAKTWEKHANIKFSFIEEIDPEAHIRISFMHKGSWSAVGQDALNEAFFPKGEPTMNYGWLTPKSPPEDYAVVLHEFGHALGLVHEHQSPASGIRWNRDAVIKALSVPPNNWDVPTIERNVLNKYGSGIVTQYSAFDPKSIMLYTFPSSWTKDGIAFAENKMLSESDIEFIKLFYPR